MYFYHPPHVLSFPRCCLISSLSHPIIIYLFTLSIINKPYYFLSLYMGHQLSARALYSSDTYKYKVSSSFPITVTSSSKPSRFSKKTRQSNSRVSTSKTGKYVYFFYFYSFDSHLYCISWLIIIISIIFPLTHLPAKGVSRFQVAISKTIS